MPTEAGMRMFVSGLLELGELSDRAREHRRALPPQAKASQVLEEAISTLSGLSRCAGLVLAPKTERPLKHIEFVPLAAGRAWWCWSPATAWSRTA